jgi:hypothetical protein
VNFNIDNDSKVIEYLAKLLALENPSAGEGKRAVEELVNTAKTGDLGKAKPVFQPVLGADSGIPRDVMSSSGLVKLAE